VDQPRTPDPSDQPATSSEPPPQNGAAAVEPVAPAAPTPEEIEATWQKRMSQRDRAHAAETQVLRDQLASYQRRPADGTPPANGQSVDGAGPTERERELERRLQEAEQGRVVERRRAKYPLVAAIVKDDDTVFAGDEASLAALNASLEDGTSSGRIAPTSPKRPPQTAPKSAREKSKEELLDDLRRVSPAYEAWQREQNPNL
jgi:hypothetical protein